MIGIARGTKATSVGWPFVEWSVAASAGREENSVNPRRVSMMPPTIRTMLSGIPNMLRIRVPKIKKKSQMFTRICTLLA